MDGHGYNFNFIKLFYKSKANLEFYFKVDLDPGLDGMGWEIVCFADAANLCSHDSYNFFIRVLLCYFVKGKYGMTTT